MLLEMSLISSCQPGYFLTETPSISCVLCPIGMISDGLTKTCEQPQGLNKKEFPATCEYTPIANRAICQAMELGKKGVVVMFPTGKFVNPVRMAITAKGAVYTADTRNSLVLKQSPTGLEPSVVGNKFESFQNVRVDANGDVFITDMATERVRKISSTTGIVINVAGGKAVYD